MNAPTKIALTILRRQAVESAGFGQGQLEAVTGAIEFVQYDPIRKPARAQELILAQRVGQYRTGDLDLFYPVSDLEEGYLYAYGALSHRLARLLHPRLDQENPSRPYRPTGLALDVLTFVHQRGRSHPKDVAAAIGRSSQTNDWGGSSAATTHCLEKLHYYGLLRVACRTGGIKVYEPYHVEAHTLSPRKRLHELVGAIVKTLAPVSHAGLRRAIRQLCAASNGLKDGATVINDLLNTDAIRCLFVDGTRYYLPSSVTSITAASVNDCVRFLAPFDPLVWDRDRFQHLWGWRYRFEAYTPPSRRTYGYYALPLLWRHRIIGWVNINRTPAGRLNMSAGYISTPPTSKKYKEAFDREVARFESMLMPRKKLDL